MVLPQVFFCTLFRPRPSDSTWLWSLFAWTLCSARLTDGSFLATSSVRSPHSLPFWDCGCFWLAYSSRAFCRQLHSSKAIPCPLTDFEQLYSSSEAPHHVLSSVYKLQLPSPYSSFLPYTTLWAHDLSQEITPENWNLSLPINHLFPAVLRKLISRYFPDGTGILSLYIKFFPWYVPRAGGVTEYKEPMLISGGTVHRSDLFVMQCLISTTESMMSPYVPPLKLPWFKLTWVGKISMLRHFLSAAWQVILTYWKSSTIPPSRNGSLRLVTSSEMLAQESDYYDKFTTLWYIWIHFCCCKIPALCFYTYSFSLGLLSLAIVR